MGRNARSGGAGWTELFFLDEVTALAAGHRPCFACRREAAKAFVGCYGEAFGVAEPKVAEIDARLHGERLASGGATIEIDRQGLRQAAGRRHHLRRPVGLCHQGRQGVALVVRRL